VVGQQKLVNKFNSYTLTTLPHSIILLGDIGCGKHLLVNELATRLNVNVIDISKNISLDLLDEISNLATPTFYIIDASSLTERNQNALLKFLEEPSVYAYIFILTTSKAILLNTILNRCIIFKFETYTKSELRNFLNDEDELILSICTTPGQVMSLHADNLKELQTLCNTIITKMSTANYQNTLSIVKKMNLKDEFDKFDINIFFNVLLNELLYLYTNTVDIKLYNMYLLVLKYRDRLTDSRLNKELFLENFLTSLWEFSRQ